MRRCGPLQRFKMAHPKSSAESESARSFEINGIFPALKGRPEPLEKEINEISSSKREDRFSNPFFELVQNTTFVRFSYLLRLCNFRKAPRDIQKFPQK